MNIFGWKFSLKKGEPPLSLEDVIDEVKRLEDRLIAVEKKAEATRRKVYRDGEPEELIPGNGQPAQPAIPAVIQVRTGDRVG